MSGVSPVSMVFRLLLAALVALVLLPMGWRIVQFAPWAAWTRPAPPPKAISFDNGTVRAPPPAAVAADRAVQPGLKKCFRGEQVLYTDGPCPAGTRAAEVTATVNVVKAPIPAASSPAALPVPGRRLPTVREVLDVSPGPSLRDQHTERILERQR